VPQPGRRSRLYGPVRTVVWEGRRCEAPPYPDLWPISGDGGRPSWRPVVGVILPPLWHQDHRGQPVPRTAAEGNYPRTAAEDPRSDGGTDGVRTSPVGRTGVVGASDMATGLVVESAMIPGLRGEVVTVVGLTQYLVAQVTRTEGTVSSV
jgi:hypothetical protein